ncbi:unnamed protein product [Danaus chrysippus]|uniref:(African queen) hypothetical protein n=1 Tax=Danaus chrysippus TaxID=151541 RepID=A0A8J2R318_9NEOP|nr:unnamed protein product [Danaus chrysippus]
MLLTCLLVAVSPQGLSPYLFTPVQVQVSFSPQVPPPPFPPRVRLVLITHHYAQLHVLSDTAYLCSMWLVVEVVGGVFPGPSEGLRGRVALGRASSASSQ